MLTTRRVLDLCFNTPAKFEVVVVETDRQTGYCRDMAAQHGGPNVKGPDPNKDQQYIVRLFSFLPIDAPLAL